MDEPTLYMNHGAPFFREDGSQIVRWQVFEPTSQELARMSYKIKLYTGPAPDPDQLPKPPAPKQPAIEWGGEWPLRMAPDLYLQLHPDGPNAELAKRLLDEHGPAEDEVTEVTIQAGAEEDPAEPEEDDEDGD